MNTTVKQFAWLTLTCLSSLAFSLQVSIADERAPGRPNILFLYADDLGYGDLGCYGSKLARTPNLDRLAKDGARYTQFYVTHCVCSPTRASSITGQYPSRSRIYGHLAHLSRNASRNMPNWLDVDSPSLPRTLQQAGYRTGIFGKWHLGGGSGQTFRGGAINSKDAPPVDRYGFDEVRITFGNGPTWKGREVAEQPHNVYPYEDTDLLTWSSQLIADSAIDFLDRHSSRSNTQPWLMYLWFSDPHTPLKPTDEMRAPFKNLPEPSQSYYSMVAFMDQQIGRILARLDELGMRENTLVLFASDNGATHTAGGSNAPLRGFKHGLYEGGIRVPFIVRWPGHVPAERVDEQSVVSIVDFMPTICRLTGVAVPSENRPDGEDISAALLGQPFTRSKPLFWHHPTVSPEHSQQLAMRKDQWKLLMNADGSKTQLYDLLEDPQEIHNLADQQTQKAKELQAELFTWYRTLPAADR